MVELMDAGGVKLAIEDRGAGPVLLLVHGFPLDHTMWDDQVAALSGVARVIAPDLRGFGASELTPGTVTMEQFADDLAALLDALDIRTPVTLCGLSMGGYVAFAFWRRHRKRLARLILCDTRATADGEAARRNRLAMAESVLDKGPSIVVRTMLPGLLAAATFDRQPAVVERLRAMIGGTDPEAIAAAQRGMAARADATEILGQIKIPVLILCGEHDTISPPAEMQALARAIPGAQYVEIADAGHMSPMENSAAVNAAIADFLQDER